MKILQPIFGRFDKKRTCEYMLWAGCKSFLFFSSDDMMMEESQEDVQMYKFDHPISNGIPPSITLQLAASKSKIPSKTTTMASTTTSSR